MAVRASIQTALEAGNWLEGLINFERDPASTRARFDLTAIGALLKRLGDPHQGLSVLHVAGSKGKGSTCLMAEAILRAGGERVGTFTSPHLERWTERFRIDGAEVEGGELARAVETIRPHVETMQAEDPDGAPTFFDVTTAAALLLFSRMDLDRVILEVGLGGRLDSTNIVEPASTCVTQIELEHTAQLGHTRAAIAAEKAGILKPGVPVVMGRLEASAAEVVVARAQEVGAPCFRLGHEFDATALEPGFEGWDACPEGAVQGFLFKDTEGLERPMGLSVLGSHQIQNAALALAAVFQLPGWVGEDRGSEARAGLMEAHLPGRVEIVARNPVVLIDSAHTSESAAALGRVLETMPSTRRRFVLSMSREKSVEAVLAHLISPESEVWITRADAYRSLPVDELRAFCERVAPGCRIVCEEDPRAALSQARGGMEESDLLCCTGSVYLAGIAREVFQAP